MKLFDFVKRSPPTTVAPLPPPPSQATAAGKTPEDVIDSLWLFSPSYVNDKGAPVYEHQQIQSVCMISIARSLSALSEDLEAIRKHLTRLQIVTPRESPEVSSPAQEQEPT